jgi:hypothetical protein
VSGLRLVRLAKVLSWSTSSLLSPLSYLLLVLPRVVFCLGLLSWSFV